MSLTIDQGTKVTMSFSLSLENGEIVDSNFDTQPATFILGDGNLLPGFEIPLKGLVDQELLRLPGFFQNALLRSSIYFN